MTTEEYSHLSEKEFYELAKSQITKYPDLLLITDEKEIIEMFYDQYKRKIPKNLEDAFDYRRI